MGNDILTIEEAAEYLRMNRGAIHKLVKEGTLPCRKVLNKWRFVKEELRQWVKSE